jgi:hypothetical protein
MSEILSFLGSIKYFIIAGITALFVFFGWWQKKKIEARDKTIEEQRTAINVYEKKDEVNKQDKEIDQKQEENYEKVEKVVRDAPNEESAAETIGNALDNFFDNSSKPE